METMNEDFCGDMPRIYVLKNSVWFETVNSQFDGGYFSEIRHDILPRGLEIVT